MLVAFIHSHEFFNRFMENAFAKSKTVLRKIVFFLQIKSSIRFFNQTGRNICVDRVQHCPAHSTKESYVGHFYRIHTHTHRRRLSFPPSPPPHRNKSIVWRPALASVGLTLSHSSVSQTCCALCP
jgi:hypothetical protein